MAAAALTIFRSRAGGRASNAERDAAERGFRRAEDRAHAFEAMLARDWDRFWRYAYRLCAGNAEDAEDLLSDSVIEAFQSFDRYRGEGFDKWLFRILTTNRIDMARRAKVRRAESLDSAFVDDDGESQGRIVADHSADPAKIVLAPMLSEDLQRALEALPEEFRAALLLCDIEQMEYQDIARVLDLPIGTVRSRIHRARLHMRKALEKAGVSTAA